jgi:hypothetical protein
MGIFSRPVSTTENRGVPGSIPGLAIDRQTLILPSRARRAVVADLTGVSDADPAITRAAGGGGRSDRRIRR